MNSFFTRTTVRVACVAAAMLIATTAQAQDPKSPKKPPAKVPPTAKAPPTQAPAPSKDPVTLVAAPKAGAVLKFRLTKDAAIEVNGNPYSLEKARYEYTVTVGEPVAGGGYTGKLKIDRMVMTGGSKGEVEYDSAKPGEKPTDFSDRIKVMLIQACTSADFEIAVGADGRMTSLKGFRESLAATIKGTALESMVPLDAAAGPKETMQLFGVLFVALPQGAHAAGAEWADAVSVEVSGSDLDFDRSSTFALPAADRAAVTSKLVWKPGAEATAGGAKAEGGGTVSSLFSRDGMPLRYEHKLVANRTTDTMNATSHDDVVIERVNADGTPVGSGTPAAPAAPTSPPPSTPPKKK